MFVYLIMISDARYHEPKIKHILCIAFFHRKSCRLWDNIEKHEARQPTGYSTKHEARQPTGYSTKHEARQPTGYSTMWCKKRRDLRAG